MGCGGFTCSKNALAALNVLYILVAFILIGVAAYGKAVAVITSISIMSGIIACGVFLLLIAFVGLVGAIKHHQVLLFFYMIILFIIFFVQFAVACACIAVNQTQQHTLVEAGWKKAGDDLKNQVQRLYNCCGFEKDDQGDTDPTHDMAHPPCGLVPGGSNARCCANDNVAGCCLGASNTTLLTSSSNITEEGAGEGGAGGVCPCDVCWPAMSQQVDQALKISGGIGLFFSFTEIIGVVLALRFRNQKDPRANPSAFL